MTSIKHLRWYRISTDAKSLKRNLRHKCQWKSSECKITGEKMKTSLYVAEEKWHDGSTRWWKIGVGCHVYSLGVSVSTIKQSSVVFPHLGQSWNSTLDEEHKVYLIHDSTPIWCAGRDTLHSTFTDCQLVTRYRMWKKAHLLCVRSSQNIHFLRIHPSSLHRVLYGGFLKH